MKKNKPLILFILFTSALVCWIGINSCPTCIGFSDSDSRPFFEQYAIPSPPEHNKDKKNTNGKKNDNGQLKTRNEKVIKTKKQEKK